MKEDLRVLVFQSCSHVGLTSNLGEINKVEHGVRIVCCPGRLLVRPLEIGSGLHTGG